MPLSMATVDWQPAWAEPLKPPLSVSVRCVQAQVGHGDTHNVSPHGDGHDPAWEDHWEV